MLPITAEELALAVHGVLVQGDGSARVDHVVIDSRKAGPGAAFVAFVGARQNGHQFVHDVVRQGAAAAIVTETVDVEDASFPIIRVQHALAAVQLLALRERRSFSGPVIGVTGSNGKTTTKEMLAAVFRAMGTCLYTEANLNTELGLPLTILRRTPQHRSMVLEMGMRGLGQIRELCDVAEPTAGIITNIGQSHLELLGSEANIASAKAELLEALPETGIAALNGDDPWLRQVAERCKGRVLWYGSDAQSDAWASDIVVTDEGTDFVAHVLGNSVNVHIPTFGIHNVHNALGALLLGAAHGIALPAAAAGLTTVPSTSGRLNIVQGSNDRVVLDDCYNASPLSVKASLRVLLDLARGRNTVAILGDMYELGSYAEAGHREVGTFAAEAGVDRLIAVGEFARWIAEAAKAAHCPYVRHYPDKDTAMRHLDTDVPHSAMVLVKASRGAALEDIVAKLVPEGR